MQEKSGQTKKTFKTTFLSFFTVLYYSKYEKTGEAASVKEMRYITHGAAETEALAEALAPVLANAPAVALYGGLGMGKTAFTRGLARALGCVTPVSSPTYTIVNEYIGPRRVCHFDLYRLADADALWEIGWDDYLSSDALCVVEWSERAPDAFPAGTVRITIDRVSDSERKITVQSC